MIRNQNIRIPLIALLIIVSALKIYSSDTLLFNTDFYHIDTTKKLILINQNVSQLNSEWRGQKVGVLLDQYYSFESPQDKLAIGRAYHVQDNQDSIFKLYTTHLPIVHITSTNEVLDDPRVFARFQLLDSTGVLTLSNIGIEYRGGFSQRFPKRSLRIEFWNDTLGESKKDVSLLGMRNDDDWNLQALFVEPLRFRNKSLFDLWSEIDTLKYLHEKPNAKNGIASEYVELFFNGEYSGLYALGERIDRKQLKLQKADGGHINGELYKMQEPMEATRFLSVPDFDNSSSTWDGYIYKHPVEIIDWTNLHHFTNFFINAPDEEFYTNYHTIIDEENAINYLLFMALIDAMDNRARNIFIARYDSVSPYFFLPWDFDASMGLDVLGSGSLERPMGIVISPFYDRLLLDSNFLYKLKLRWKALRNGPINYEHIIGFFELHYNYLLQNGVYERENIAWNWYEYDESDWDFITQWTARRLEYLDDYFNDIEAPNGISTQNSFAKNTGKNLVIYPNPARNILHIKGNTVSGRNVSIVDLQGKQVFNRFVTTTELDISYLQKGIYVIVITDNRTIIIDKLIKE